MCALAWLSRFVMGAKVRDIVIRRACDGLVFATAVWMLSSPFVPSRAWVVSAAVEEVGLMRQTVNEETETES